MGAPIIAAKPWNSIRMPKALVSFSKPIKSTTKIERSPEKQAEEKENTININKFDPSHTLRQLTDGNSEDEGEGILVPWLQDVSTEDGRNSSNSNCHIV